MRFIYLLLLVAFVGTLAVFAWQNQATASLQFLRWSLDAPLSLVVGAVYVLGMVTGWTVVGLLRRSLYGVAESPRGRAHTG
jgi:uncharacterized integral membrane protein